MSTRWIVVEVEVLDWANNEYGVLLIFYPHFYHSLKHSCQLLLYFKKNNFMDEVTWPDLYIHCCILTVDNCNTRAISKATVRREGGKNSIMSRSCAISKIAVIIFPTAPEGRLGGDGLDQPVRLCLSTRSRAGTGRVCLGKDCGECCSPTCT